MSSVTTIQSTFDQAVERVRQFAARSGYCLGSLWAPDAGGVAAIGARRAEGADTTPCLWTTVLPTPDPTDEQVAQAIDGTPQECGELLVLVHTTSAGDATRNRVDRRAIESGFRRHPLVFTCVEFAEIEDEVGWLLLPYERIAPDVARRYPLSRLAIERSLHMDMSRAEGRRSDAHLARYRFASERLGHDARIVDAASGFGYGSYLLWREAPRRRVTGVDLSSWVVDYANASFGGPAGAPRFLTGDVGNLSSLADASFDAVVSFETIEHLLDPAPFLSHARRILADDGLLIASVPYRWIIDGDLGAHHHDWFDAPKLLELCGRFLSVESLWIETAGGGRYMRDARRGWRPVSVLGDVPDDPIEWLIVVARKRPAVSRATKSWLVLAPDVSHLATIAAALPAWGVSPADVHVRGCQSTWDDEYERAMDAACTTLDFEYGGNLPISPSLIEAVGDPLDYAPDDPRGRDDCGERVRRRYPILDDVEGFNVVLATRPDAPEAYALLAGLRPNQVRLVTDGSSDDVTAHDKSGARGFEENALVRWPADVEIAGPPWLARDSALGQPVPVDATEYAAVLDRIASMPAARGLATEIATRPVPFTAVVIDQNLAGAGLTPAAVSSTFLLHQVRALLGQTPGAVLFKAHPRTCRHTLVALADALRDDAPRVHVVTGIESYLPLEAFAAELQERTDTIEFWSSSAPALIGIAGSTGARPRCIDADYLEPEIRQQAMQGARQHRMPMMTLRFADAVLTEAERQHLRRRFLPRPSDRKAAMLEDQVKELEGMHHAARTRMEALAARLAEVEQHAADALLLEALITTGHASVWIWGTGAGGRHLRQRLHRLGVRPVGFLDSAAMPAVSEVESVPVLSAGNARAAREAGALVVIASVHAGQILERINEDGDWQSTIRVWSAR